MASYVVIYAPWPHRVSVAQQQNLLDFLQREEIIGSPLTAEVWSRGIALEKLGLTIHGHPEVSIINRERAGAFGGESFEPLCPTCKQVLANWVSMMDRLYEHDEPTPFTCPHCGTASTFPALPILGGGAIAHFGMSIANTGLEDWSGNKSPALLRMEQILGAGLQLSAYHM